MRQLHISASPNIFILIIHTKTRNEFTTLSVFQTKDQDDILLGKPEFWLSALLRPIPEISNFAKHLLYVVKNTRALIWAIFQSF